MQIYCNVCCFLSDRGAIVVPRACANTEALQCPLEFMGRSVSNGKDFPFPCHLAERGSFPGPQLRGIKIINVLLLC